MSTELAKSAAALTHLHDGQSCVVVLLHCLPKLCVVLTRRARHLGRTWPLRVADHRVGRARPRRLCAALHRFAPHAHRLDAPLTRLFGDEHQKDDKESDKAHRANDDGREHAGREERRLGDDHFGLRHNWILWIELDTKRVAAVAAHARRQVFLALRALFARAAGALAAQTLATRRHTRTAEIV